MTDAPAAPPAPPRNLRARAHRVADGWEAQIVWETTIFEKWGPYDRAEEAIRRARRKLQALTGAEAPPP